MPTPLAPFVNYMKKLLMKFNRTLKHPWLPVASFSKIAKTFLSPWRRMGFPLVLNDNKSLVQLITIFFKVSNVIVIASYIDISLQAINRFLYFMLQFDAVSVILI